MQNRPRSRTDVQWIISSVSLAITLGLWGILAAHDKKGASVSAEVTMPQPTEQVVVTQPQQMLAPGQVLLFGGTAPQPQQKIVITKRAKGGGGGGGAGAGAPAASTGSSRP